MAAPGIRRRALAAAGTDSLLITHPANVRYLTGFTGSAGCVLLTPRRQLFFTDFRYRAQSARQVKRSDVHIVNGPAVQGAAAYAATRKLKLGVLGYEAESISQRQYARLKRQLKGVRLKDAGGAVGRLRLVKTAGELRRIRRACRITDAAFSLLTATRITGKQETEVAWMLESAMREAGSGPMPFPVIVASGPRSAMPHGAASERIIRRGELVVIDMGASVDGYCSDATRTFATGRLPRKLNEIYGIVNKARRLALASVRPGVNCADIDRAARDHIAAAGYGDCFGHALGHGVGLEAHEGPVLSSRSRDRLEAGMTVTIEPGIYLAGLGGVRIEDTVLVGSQHGSRLTRFTDEPEPLR